jgi:hypothetical protein
MARGKTCESSRVLSPTTSRDTRRPTIPRTPGTCVQPIPAHRPPDAAVPHTATEVRTARRQDEAHCPVCFLGFPGSTRLFWGMKSKLQDGQRYVLEGCCFGFCRTFHKKYKSGLRVFSYSGSIVSSTRWPSNFVALCTVGRARNGLNENRPLGGCHASLLSQEPLRRLPPAKHKSIVKHAGERELRRHVQASKGPRPRCSSKQSTNTIGARLRTRLPEARCLDVRPQH